MRRPDPLLAGLVLVLYVLPLTAAVIVLALVGLPRLALALLAVEAVVSAAVLAARRPARGAAERADPPAPDRGGGEPP